VGGINIPFPAHASPRERIIIAAKHLMSAVGYENTTTEAICREANVSEAQLTKYFGTKEALLQAIFEEGWARLRMNVPMLQTVESPRNRIKMLIHLIIHGFSDDRPWRDLMLLEGRRIRGEGKMVMLTAGYRELVALLDSLISAELKGKASRHQVQLVRSAIIGVFEGLLRDVVLHERFDFPADFSAEQVEHYMADVLDRLLRPVQP
jgi:AcrR family transcriptional regulator